MERWRTEKECRKRGRGETEMERQRKREREGWGKSERARGKSVRDVINQLANGTYYGVRPRDSFYRRQSTLEAERVEKRQCRRSAQKAYELDLKRTENAK